MEPDPGRGRLALWVVVALAASLLFLSANSVPLIDPDESRFARTSVEMMRSRDLVVPSFEGRPRLVKPPLMHWIQSNFFRLFGVHEWVARLHAFLATLGSLLLVAWVGRRRFGEEGATWAAAVMATMPLVVAVGHLGTLDALLALHVFAVPALDLAGPRDSRRYSAIAIGALLGLAFLVKGPVGVVLPLLIVLAGRTASGREVVPPWGSVWRAVVAWCVVVLPWGVAFLQRVGGSAVGSTLRGEVLESYFGGTGHVKPPVFYLGVLAVGMLPWTVPLVLGLVRTVLQRRQAASATARYAAAGLVVGILFFTLGRNKLPNYLVPLAPLAAIVVTWEIGQQLGRPASRRWGLRLLTASLGAFAAVLAVAGVWDLAADYRQIALAGAAIYGLGSIVALVATMGDRPRWAYGAAAATSALFLALVFGLLFPVLSRTRTSAHLIREVPALSESRPLITVDMKVPSLTFYLDRIPEEVAIVALEARLDREDDPVLVFDEADLPGTPPSTLARLRELGRQGKYIVFEKE